MSSLKLTILIVGPILLLTVSIGILYLEKPYRETMGLTEELISFLENKPSSLKNEGEKDAYIKYLSDGIIRIKKDSDDSIEDLWTLYKPLSFFLMAVSVLQLIIVAPFLFDKFLHTRGIKGSKDQLNQ